MRTGTEGMADYELVELLLTLAIPRLDVKRPAKALIARFQNLRGILDAPIEELRTVDGVGAVTPVALKIIRAAALYHPQRVEEAGMHFDETVRRIQAQDFAVQRPPEATICKECDLPMLCHSEGIISKEARG